MSSLEQTVGPYEVSAGRGWIQVSNHDDDSSGATSLTGSEAERLAYALQQAGRYANGKPASFLTMKPLDGDRAG